MVARGGIEYKGFEDGVEVMRLACLIDFSPCFFLLCEFLAE